MRNLVPRSGREVPRTARRHASAHLTRAPLASAARSTPLLARPFARYACFGDGLCCTDIHSLGPVTPIEAQAGLVVAVPHPRLPMLTLALTPTGACLQLAASGTACALHASHGPLAKPASCRRFPYGLVETPGGGRVTTAHRCPCRTMGERPLLDLDDAARSLGIGSAVEPAAHADDAAVLRLTSATTIPFADYVVRESAALEALERGGSITAVLADLGDSLGLDGRDAVESDVLPTLGPSAPPWLEVAYRYRGMVDGSRCGAALAWFGDALAARHAETRVPLRARPWSDAFDRAEARATESRSGARVLADWASDVLWSLPFVREGCVASTVLELSIRAELARALAMTLTRAGVRSDRAMAEAILVVEIGGAVPLWREVVASLGDRATPSPAPSR